MFLILSSLIVTLVATPAMAAAGRRLGLIDTPNQRSMHSRPTARSGGVACMIGMLIAFAVGSAMGRPVPWALLAVAFALGMVGLADDRANIRPLYRLLVQALAGAVAGLLLGGGWWVLVGAVLLPVTVNMLNFMDGINGITCLSMIVWSVMLAVAGGRWGQPELWVVGLVVAGAAAGFLPWNAPRARAFLGDGGSYVFGGLVGVGSMLGARGDVPVGVLVGPMIIYLADTGSTLIRRAIRREPLLQPHRSHIYQRVVSRTGWPHLAVSALVAALSVGVTAAWFAPQRWVGAVVTVIVVAGYLAAPMLVPAQAAPSTNGEAR
jgi:UDP-N-acetylmuramyl pentapeptide phosphotransferase/UDP-N-acetylglucosamine-1-phosphate transferase